MSSQQSTQLLARIREALVVEQPVREVAMFGGRCLMVREAMLGCVMSQGDLLVRVDPANSGPLLARTGARQAEMGAGRSMGKSWITVAADAVATDDELNFWMVEALAFNTSLTEGF